MEKVIEKTTDEIYRSPVEYYNDTYADTRREIDYTYHSYYIKERQILQDEIVTKLLSVGRVMEKPWLIYTAGIFGAGKSYTIRKFSELGFFPLLAFVLIDPDHIKSLLPDMKIFIKENADTAGTRVHKESALISEIAERQALKMNKCLLIDGSLHNFKWYEQRLKTITKNFPQYSKGLIYVSAPVKLIYSRIKSRSLETGRNIPVELIAQSIRKVPEAVAYLSNFVDLSVTICNDNDREFPIIIKPKLKYDNFNKNMWFKLQFKNIWDYLEKNKKDTDIKELIFRIENYGSKERALSVNGGYYMKYLKYKSKYLKLKSQIKL